MTSPWFVGPIRAPRLIDLASSSKFFPDFREDIDLLLAKLGGLPLSRLLLSFRLRTVQTSPFGSVRRTLTFGPYLKMRDAHAFHRFVNLGMELGVGVVVLRSCFPFQ